LPYKSDSLWNYEAGLRLLPAANLNLDLSAFAIDWKDVQVSTADSAGFVIISNVPKARSTGLEAALAWRPSAQWQLSSALALTSSSIRADFTSAAGRAVASGTKLPGVAKLQASVDATYNFAGPWDTAGSASAVLQHTGSRPAQLDADLDLPSYSTLDLRVGFAGSNWELTAFASNVTNTKGLSSAAVNYATYINPGEVNFREWYRVRPRTIGFSLRYDY
jgi:iron complex outermembrane recepter protein